MKSFIIFSISLFIFFPSKSTGSDFYVTIAITDDYGGGSNTLDTALKNFPNTGEAKGKSGEKIRYWYAKRYEVVSENERTYLIIDIQDKQSKVKSFHNVILIDEAKDINFNLFSDSELTVYISPKTDPN